MVVLAQLQVCFRIVCLHVFKVNFRKLIDLLMQDGGEASYLIVDHYVEEY